MSVQGKTGHMGNEEGPCETDFVHGVKDVAKRSQRESHGKNAAKKTGRRQKLQSNR